VDKRRHQVFATLPFLRAIVDPFPQGVDAVLCTGDLQGWHIPINGKGICSRLLGEAVADELSHLSIMGKVPPLNRMGVVLTGDLYIQPELNTRKGNGDVRSVWRAFARRCAWVTGVAGNHDRFGQSRNSLDVFRRESGMHYLDRDIFDVDGIRLGGLSGVIGDARRPFRKSDEDFSASLTRLLSWNMDMLVLHEGPDDEASNFEGNTRIRRQLVVAHRVLCVCGHSCWDEPLRQLRNGSQLLNVDSRVVVLTAARVRL
jgi:hypothetical protein